MSHRELSVQGNLDIRSRCTLASHAAFYKPQKKLVLGKNVILVVTCGMVMHLTRKKTKQNKTKQSKKKDPIF